MDLCKADGDSQVIDRNKPNGQMTEDNPERTPEEQAVIDTVAERKSEEYAEEHAELILLDARRVGLI